MKEHDRDVVIWLALLAFLGLVATFGIGYCNLNAPCEVWRGSTIDQVPARCIGELTR